MPFSTFLNGKLPTQLRGLQWLSLSELASIGTRTYVSDGGGGGTASWSYNGSIPCRIDPAGGSEDVVAERMTDRSIHTVLVPAGTSVDENDRVLISGRGTFEVIAAEQRSAEWVRALSVVQVF